MADLLHVEIFLLDSDQFEFWIIFHTFDEVMT